MSEIIQAIGTLEPGGKLLILLLTFIICAYGTSMVVKIFQIIFHHYKNKPPKDKNSNDRIILKG